MGNKKPYRKPVRLKNKYKIFRNIFFRLLPRELCYDDHNETAIFRRKITKTQYIVA